MAKSSCFLPSTEPFFNPPSATHSPPGLGHNEGVVLGSGVVAPCAVAIQWIKESARTYAAKTVDATRIDGSYPEATS